MTPSQQAAVAARGNVLVVAGAGTGKTQTLIERCCSLLLEENCSLDEILMVTFTEAAAAEMRKRIRTRLAEAAELADLANLAELAEAAGQATKERLARHLEEQMALLDTAYISTLHGFCLRLLREHFHDERLRLDPEFVVLTEEQVHQLRNKTLDALLESHYGGDADDARAFRKLVTEQAGGAENRVRELIWQLHRYSRSLADPAGWIEKQLAMFGESEPTQWRDWLRSGFSEWREYWSRELTNFSETPNVADCLGALAAVRENSSLETVGEGLSKIQEAHGSRWPRGSIGAVRDQISDFFSDAEFLSSLLPDGDGEDPLVQDWKWSRGHMQTLLRLAREFSDLFDEAKREAGGVDFADLEQFALRLLWDSKSGGPTSLARDWQQRLKYVFVDEYQDINGAQDTILRAVSRDSDVAADVPSAVEPGVSPGGGWGKDTERPKILEQGPGGRMPPSTAGGTPAATAGNRFLVGDVKQSIYRFRLADPKIFQAYKKVWSEPVDGGGIAEKRSRRVGTALQEAGARHSTGGCTIPLSDNFRSREALLDFVNSFFALLMREEIGGVAYNADARLKFGAPEKRADFSRKADAAPQVEIHLCAKTKNHDNGGAEPNGADFVDLDVTEREARLLALQLKKLRREKFRVWDDEKKIFRAVEWRDMVVLLRSPRNKAEIFAREFNRAGVPLHVKRGSFYSATEVSDLLSLLQLLDNPMQDLPLLAVLRSPLVGLSVDELAMIRAGQQQDRFWTALLRFGATLRKFSGEAGAIAAAAQPKVRAFLTSFDLWRRHARQGAISDCMRGILDETHYETMVLAQERGEERLANVNRLLRLMRQFDPYQRQGLLRFLRFVESQRDAEAEEEPASPDIADAVRLLSIHQSKGLEFPVVAVADLGKSFNFADLHADVLLDAEFGLCAKIAPPKINARYPSLPYWLARQRQKKELLGEELRLLYVAMTRARDRLILAGSVSPKQLETRWKDHAGETPALPGKKTRSHGDRDAGTTSLLQARSYADWLAIWFAKNCAVSTDESEQCAHASLEGETTPVPPGGTPRLYGRRDACRYGETKLCRWTVHDDTSLIESAAEAAKENGKQIVHLSKSETERLRRRLSAGYPFGVATNEPAKTSVSALRRRAMELFEQEERVDIFRRPDRRRNPAGAKKADAKISPAGRQRSQGNAAKAKESSADVGTIYHRFLERVSFDRVNELKELRAEATRMIEAGILSAAEVKWLNFDSLLAFWRSEFGRKILTHAAHVRRELAFTARFLAAELEELKVQTSTQTQEHRTSNVERRMSNELSPGTLGTSSLRPQDLLSTPQPSSGLRPPSPAPAGEGTSSPLRGEEGESSAPCAGSIGEFSRGLEDDFIIVQGVADLAVILSEEIWLLDFKTDDAAGSELVEKSRIYEPQLRLYARALERIYRRPVSECRIHFLACGETVQIQKSF